MHCVQCTLEKQCTANHVIILSVWRNICHLYWYHRTHYDNCVTYFVFLASIRSIIGECLFRTTPWNRRPWQVWNVHAVNTLPSAFSQCFMFRKRLKSYIMIFIASKPYMQMSKLAKLCWMTESTESRKAPTSETYCQGSPGRVRIRDSVCIVGIRIK